MISKQIVEPEFIVVDLFCGAGGTTTGFEMADGRAKVIACVNHDKNAIKSHWLNHPDVVHFEEDIRTLNLDELIKIVNKYRILYPNAKLVLWISLECTNFSKAKGGLPRDADSRTLADDCKRYIVALNPDIIQIENVVEFMAWGPLVAKVIKTEEGYECCEVKFVQQYEFVLDENGDYIYEKIGRKQVRKEQLSNHWKTFCSLFPESRTNGKEWMRWRKEICDLGYYDEWKQLNAADFGAYTSRNRLFGMFAKDQELITFPEKTHSKKKTINVDNRNTLFSSLENWKPVKEVLDLEDDGKSIFGRKKDLSDKTLERIYAGLIKFVANGDQAFLSKYYSGKPEGKVISLNGPSGTIRTSDSHAIIQTSFLLKYNSVNGKTGKHNPPSIEEPCPVISTQNRLGVVNPCFLTKYHGKGTNILSIESAASTLSTKDRLAKVSATWIDRNFSGGGNVQSIESPSGSILGTPKLNLVKAEKFILNSNFNNVGSSIQEPSPVITASRKHHYLVNPQWGVNCGSSIEKPCFTLIARMDKTPPYIVTTDTGEIAIEVYETDTPIVVKIKQFMAAYSIGDILMRMLNIPELLKIQGFPNDYELHGTQTEQKKFIGNSVHPLVVKKWTEAISERIKKVAA